MAFQNICILGHTGNVGKELVKQVVALDGEDQGHDNPTRIVGLVNTKGFLINPTGIPNPEALTDRTTFQTTATPHTTEDPLQNVYNNICSLGLKDDIVFVDATADASDTMLGLHRLVVSNQQKLVTANKNPISLFTYEDFQALTENRSLYRFNASVMAGGDAIPFVQDALDTQNKLHTLQGCFSGTLGYITSELQKNRKFSEIVREAKEKKFTEPHPWDDLNGLDVARKLLILVRTSGLPVTKEQLSITPMIPASYGDITDSDEFLESLKKEDENISQQVKKAEDEGNVLRYVAEYDFNHPEAGLKVQFKPVKKTSPLGQLQGTKNMIQIQSSIRNIDITTEGAGVEITANALRRDLLYFLPNRKHQ